MTLNGIHQMLGPLAGTMPCAVLVLACLLTAIAAARVAAGAIRRCKAFLLLGSWTLALASFVAGSVAFQAFAWGGTSPISLAAVAAFVGQHGVLLAAVLLGGVTAASIELTTGARPVAAEAPAAAGRRSRAEAIGAIGESLVAAELRSLGWPTLQNVVLVCGGHSAEIDHLLRAPDGIVIVETKTLSGVVWGQPGGQTWSQEARGEERRFLNPLIQNESHMAAVREVIGDEAVCLRGLVVAPGKARFAGPIAGCVVPLRDLAEVLRGSVSVPLLGQGAIDAAWRTLVAEAAMNGQRHERQVDYVRRRRSARFGWL